MQTISPEPTKGQGRDDSVEEREITKFTELLIEYYAHALALSRAQERTSRGFAVLGGLLLFSGLGLSIALAGSAGADYRSAVQAAAGVVTTTVSMLFSRRATEALAHLQGQTDKLRQDSGARRQMAKALQLLNTVTDEALQNQLRAGVIIKLASAQHGDFPLPSMQPVSRNEHGTASTNGAVRRPASPGTPDS